MELSGLWSVSRVVTPAEHQEQLWELIWQRNKLFVSVHVKQYNREVVVLRGCTRIEGESVVEYQRGQAKFCSHHSAQREYQYQACRPPCRSLTCWFWIWQNNSEKLKQHHATSTSTSTNARCQTACFTQWILSQDTTSSEGLQADQ
jgi:hypothetical protein